MYSQQCLLKTSAITVYETYIKIYLLDSLVINTISEIKARQTFFYKIIYMYRCIIPQ